MIELSLAKPKPGTYTVVNAAFRVAPYVTSATQLSTQLRNSILPMHTAVDWLMLLQAGGGRVLFSFLKMGGDCVLLEVDGLPLFYLNFVLFFVGLLEQHLRFMKL